jgi:hypothetical protein
MKGYSALEILFMHSQVSLTEHAAMSFLAKASQKSYRDPDGSPLAQVRLDSAWSTVQEARRIMKKLQESLGRATWPATTGYQMVAL